MKRNLVFTLVGVVLVGVLALAVVSIVGAQESAGAAEKAGPYLGVIVHPAETGAQVLRVAAGSPAATAGVQPLDIIKRINDEPVRAATFADQLNKFKPGDEINLQISRGEQTMTLKATLGERPAPVQPSSLMTESISYDAQAKTWTLNALSAGEPLYAAGLRQGDKITLVNGEAVDPAGLRRLLEGKAEDEKFAVTYERDGQTLKADVPVSALRTLNIFEIGFEEMPFFFGLPEGPRAALGVQFRSLTEDVAKEFDLTVTTGDVITGVMENSPAAEAGLKTKDVITAVNGEPVNNEYTLRDRLMAFEPGDTVKLDILRGTEKIQVDVTLGTAAMPVELIPFFQVPEISWMVVPGHAANLANATNS